MHANAGMNNNEKVQTNKSISVLFFFVVSKVLKKVPLVSNCNDCLSANNKGNINKLKNKD